MTAMDCGREQDLLDALVSGRWPSRCDADLRAHVHGCESCRDTLAVALPLLRDGEAAFSAAEVPSSAVVWWRAQMRARREAERAANRPIAVVQAAAVVFGVALVAAALMWTKPALLTWSGGLRELASRLGMTAAAVANAPVLQSWGMLAWVAVGMWVVAAPLAIYVALRED